MMEIRWAKDTELTDEVGNLLPTTIFYNSPLDKRVLLATNGRVRSAQLSRPVNEYNGIINKAQGVEPY